MFWREERKNIREKKRNKKKKIELKKRIEKKGEDRPASK